MSDEINQALDQATTLVEVKRAHDRASALVDAAISAKNFSLLDEAVEARCRATRRGGAMLLAGAERVPGVEVDVWERRAAMDEAAFAGAVRRAQAMQRRRCAGEPPPPHTARGAEDGPQCKTLISPWQADRVLTSDGIKQIPTRYVVGVSPTRYRSELAAGRDRETVEATLIREAVERAL